MRSRDLLRWAAASLRPASVAEDLAGAIRTRFGVRHVFLSSTGRAGLTVLLSGLKRLAPADRTEVVLPAYTCFSVAASVVKAGLVPRIVDISPETLDFDRRALTNLRLTRVLAIVATNLYGLPNDMPLLRSVADAARVFLIDDAAQAMGASVAGRASGTWGHAGLFSFDKGKNVSAIDGGVIVTDNDDIADVLRESFDALPAARAADMVSLAVKAVGYWGLLRPALYGIPERIPQLDLGKTVFTTDFPLHRPGRLQTALQLTMLDRLDSFTHARQQNASALIAGLESIPGVRAVRPTTGATPVYLRLPVLVEDDAERVRLLARLKAQGIGATASYPAALADVPDLDLAASEVPRGRAVARRILTLPTHPFVQPRDVETMLDAIGRTRVTAARVA